MSRIFFLLLTDWTYSNNSIQTEDNNLMRMVWNGSLLRAERCAESSEFSGLLLNVSPYLYPFSIEYSILVGMLLSSTFVLLF